MAHLVLGRVELLAGGLQEGLSQPLQPWVAGQADDVVHPRLASLLVAFQVALAPLVDAGQGLAAVAAHHDPHLGPGRPQPRHDPLEEAYRPVAGVDLTRSQHRRQQLVRLAVGLGEHQHRQVAVRAVVAVEESQLLLAVGWVDGGVQVEDDLLRRLAMALEEQVEEDFGQAVQLARRDRVLEPRERGLGGQVVAGIRVAPAGDFQHRVGGEGVGVVAVLVATGYLIDALAQEIEEGLADLGRLAAIPQARCETLGQTRAAVHLGQPEEAAVGADLPAIEASHDLLATKETEVERRTLCHRRRAPVDVDFVLADNTFHVSPAILSFLLMHNPG